MPLDSSSLGLDLFEPDLFTALYRPVQTGTWEIRLTEMVYCPGYWGPPQLVGKLAALLRHGKVWMSVTPLELESQRIGIEQAHGHVAIFGLGMGWAAAATALRNDVTSVTVVEFDPEVIALHRELDVFGQLPPRAQAKLRIEQGDAYSWRPDRPVDLLMPDIWLPLVSEGRVDEVRAMQANVGAQAVYFWGQELEIARHAGIAGRKLDDAGISATIADLALPLVGPDTSDYPARVAAAAARWLKNE